MTLRQSDKSTSTQSAVDAVVADAIRIGADFANRYAQSGDIADLNQAIECFEKVNAPEYQQAEQFADLISRLSEGLWIHYSESGDQSDLDRIEPTLDLGRKLSQAGTTIWTQHSINLAIALYERNQRSSLVADLVHATRIFQEINDLSGSIVSSHASYWYYYAEAQIALYRATSNPDLLQSAISAYQTSARHDRSEHRQAMSIYGLAQALLLTYDRTESPEALEQSISMHREAVKRFAPQTSSRTMAQNGLANALVARFRGLGSAVDLDEAVDVLREALELETPGSISHVAIILNLADCLRYRFFATGDLTDIGESIRINRLGLTCTSLNANQRAAILDSLACGLKSRYDVRRQAGDLHTAIACSEEALRLTTDNNGLRQQNLIHLGSALLERFERTQDHETIDAVLTYFLEARQLPCSSTANQASILNNIGNAYRKKFAVAGNVHDLDQAIDAYQEAIDLSPNTAEHHSTFRANAARALRNRFELAHDAADLSRAVSLYEETCHDVAFVRPHVALIMSRAWSQWAMGRQAWDEARRALTIGTEALDRLLHSQLLRSDKEDWLQHAQDLPRDMAYVLARQNDLGEAVLALEHGRTRFLSESLESLHFDQEWLRSKHPALYRDYIQAANRLADCEAPSPPAPLADDLSAYDHRRIVHKQFVTIIAAIRSLPEYESCVPAATLDRVTAALTCPIQEGYPSSMGIYLLLTAVGGLALIIHPQGISPLWLDLTTEEVSLFLTRNEGTSMESGYTIGQLGRLEHSQLCLEIDAVLSIVSQRIVHPLTQAIHELVDDRVVVPVHLTLIPAGVLASLPIHAAEYERAGTRSTLLDDYSISYLPCASVALHIRGSVPSRPAQTWRWAGIGNPQPLPSTFDKVSWMNVTLTPLPHAEFEVLEIASLFGSKADLLTGSEATLAAVQEIVNERSCVHFACHGIFYRREPLSSGLILANGERITVSSLIGRNLPFRSQLIVLSACQTAMSDSQYLPEEAVGLVGALLQIGVPRVIGSLWPVADASTALLMVRFYHFLLAANSDPDEESPHPAHALRKAQLWLRDASYRDLLARFAYQSDRAGGADVATAREALMRSLFRGHAKSPDDRPFAHPYHWGAFAFYGV